MLVTTNKVTKEITLNDGSNTIILNQNEAKKLGEILSKTQL